MPRVHVFPHLLDWLACRFPPIHRLLHPPHPLLLIRDGRIVRRNLEAELLTREDLMEQLRQQGIERFDQVRRCYVESDGHLSGLRYDDEHPRKPRERVTAWRPCGDRRSARLLGLPILPEAP